MTTETTTTETPETIQPTTPVASEEVVTITNVVDKGLKLSYYQTHKEQYKVYNQRYRAKKKGLTPVLTSE